MTNNNDCQVYRIVEGHSVRILFSRELPGPNLTVLLSLWAVWEPKSASSLSQWILAHRNNISIQENLQEMGAMMKREKTKKQLLQYNIPSHLFHDGGHVSDVCGDDEGRGNDAPHSEFCAVFHIRLSGTVTEGEEITATPFSTSHDEVSIIPSTRPFNGGGEKYSNLKAEPELTGIFCFVSIDFYYGCRWLPVVMVIRATPPGIGILCHPLPRIFHPPLTSVEENGLPRCVQSLRLNHASKKPTHSNDNTYHLSILDFWTQSHIADVCIAPIHLHVWIKSNTNKN